jgi:hypothetical protein
VVLPQPDLPISVTMGICMLTFNQLGYLINRYILPLRKIQAYRRSIISLTSARSAQGLATAFDFR